MSNVSLLTPDKILPVIILAKQMYLESPRTKTMDFDGAEFAKTLCRCIEHDDYACFVAEIDGEVVGVCAGQVFKSDFGHAKLAIDIGLYIKPDRRNYYAAKNLVKAYVAWAEERGAKNNVWFGACAGIDNEKAARFLERCGFERAGYQLIYRG
jgi:GNAT superfamily N-acetyltransferase